MEEDPEEQEPNNSENGLEAEPNQHQQPAVPEVEPEQSKQVRFEIKFASLPQRVLVVLFGNVVRSIYNEKETSELKRKIVEIDHSVANTDQFAFKKNSDTAEVITASIGPNFVGI